MVWPFKKKPTRALNSQSIPDVAEFAKHLGLDLTPYGAGVALLSVESGYSPAETASHFAVATFAHDARTAMGDLEATLRLAPRAMAVLECLKDLKDRGFIREELWRNDSTALFKMSQPSPETSDWIDRVLSDPMVANEAVAISRI